ncbi:MAG TPA: hypothetical protein VMT95_13860 [Candidatus Binatia bacterium]|nr:hypothetical protein [Candidatus Binatia bacterium]
MATAATALVVLVAAALVAAAILLLRWRPPRVEPIETTSDARDWAAAAGAEFAHLSDADRCDLAFAVAALDDARSQRLLAEALDDPSETVALAAARAMTNRGRSSELERYLARPGERSRRIAAALSLFC